MFNELSRRRLMTTVAGFSAAAAINPFPKIVPSAFAQSASSVASPLANLPEKADSQVVQFATTGTTSMALWTWDWWWWNMDWGTYLAPFLQTPSGDIAPGLCSDYSVSDDQLTYTFTVDPKATWSDGTKITSHDIKYSWEYMANVAVSNNYYNYYQTNWVEGNADVVSGKATEMSGLVAVDDATLQITLTRPFSPFIYYCTHSLMGVHQRANIMSGTDWTQKPTVASGPFKIDSFDVESGAAVLVQNPHWWGQKPTLERIELVPVSDTSSQLLVWSNDECEMLGTDFGQFIQQFGNQDIAIPPFPDFIYMDIDVTQKPFDDVHVRRAFQKAIDIETLVHALYDPWVIEPSAIPAATQAYYTAPTGIVPPNDSAYISRPYLFDAAGAKAELAQSSYAGSELPPVAVISSPGTITNAATIMQQMWQDNLGVSVQIVPSDRATSEQISSAQLNTTGNSCYDLGPGAILSWAFLKDNGNFSTLIKTDDEDVQGAIEKADAIQDARSADRLADYQQAEQLILDRGYVIPMWWDAAAIALKPRFVNANVNYTFGIDLINGYIARE